MPRCNLLAVGAVVALLGSSIVSEAQCLSHAGDTQLDYLEYRDGRFTICYSAEYLDDLDIFRSWTEAAFELGRTKYGVLNPTWKDNSFRLTIYAPPHPTQLTSQGLVRMACCYDDTDGRTTHAEIYYMTPSAWEG